MSRLCVKNLPKYADENRLREFFSQKGEVTDAKLMRTRDGKSRQFAFIGFKTEKEAEDALNYFNNSYMDTCKITCEVAHRVGDPNIPRPWSHYSAKKVSTHSPNDSNKKSEMRVSSSTSDDSSLKQKNAKPSEYEDPKFREFLQIMQPRSKQKMWDNDTLAPSDAIVKDGNVDQEKGISLSRGERVSSETVDRVQLNEDDNTTDMEYFKSRVKANWSDSEDSEIEGDASDGEPSKPDVNDEMIDMSGIDQALMQVESSKTFIEEKNDNEIPNSSFNDEYKQELETGRLFIRNLPYTATEDDLAELFSQFGELSEVHLVVDKDTKRSKGIGYVLYALPESAIRALEELDNSIFQGRLLHIMPAKGKNPTSEKIESEHATSKKNLKQLRQEQRKASEASGDTRAWNALFMRQDTVVEHIARKHGIRKSDLLDNEANDLAVRVALAETHVIAETKKALSNAGVNIKALEEFASKKAENSKRSNHVILVKNLPYTSNEGDLAGMFGKYGSLNKVVLPPTRVLALVVFLEAGEARAAFKGLAYKRYKDVPLYLEWAPTDILSPSPKLNNEEQNNVVGEEKLNKVLIRQAVEGIAEEEIDPDKVESRSVFVKNLNFKTTDELLRNHFSDKMKNGTLKSVKVKKHVKGGKNVSMGFGFIEFDSVETATDVCKDLQGTVLDGHALILQLCHSKKASEAPKNDEKNKSSTTLMVKNVAFEATEKDLKQLFSPFGQIKSLRLPVKFGGHHKGYAFVEYITKQEAQNAMENLSSTHLYGRHLVLERAKDKETMEDLRAKAAAQFADGHNVLSKKRKQDTLAEKVEKIARIL
ncbi:multiple RNA-binding domain-containing protein 1-like [Zingiber officinale]|uniref:multiple RNA-binding domain-containing protein 1-like n=1 Tax=Zingiber officinale TaxID=94328 RepID=UPI001C4CCE35|nr:multiple RNA-binding domain-containing protein 1-like [Zingiber officinale]